MSLRGIHDKEVREIREIRGRKEAGDETKIEPEMAIKTTSDNPRYNTRIKKTCGCTQGRALYIFNRNILYVRVFSLLRITHELLVNWKDTKVGEKRGLRAEGSESLSINIDR
ncbi:hypothetical protein KQX54_019970 [Cotesia glomerata]|uniref:Uncharacterized protein n=1 Tax=Cotesia glomerata TaxID=32391 RepID=A0AAV7HZJ6_COTGL|nr:hypothetical protein KQX54_019970 [Cotesia glomerata]